MGAKLLCLCLLAALLGYYIYSPLPEDLAEPWTVMLLSAAFRAVGHLSEAAELLGLMHYMEGLQLITTLQLVPPTSDENVTVTDTAFNNVPVRLYLPRRAPGGLRRAMVYFHGGGWCLGDAGMHGYDHMSRRISNELNAVLVSVNYRLAPQHRFPAQFEDVYSVTKFFLQSKVLSQYGVDPARVCVAGDSAGGNLAAAVAQQLLEDPEVETKLKAQLLIYPALQALDLDLPSYRDNAHKPLLPRALMAVNETGDSFLMNRVLEKYYLSTMYSLEFILGAIGNTIVVFGYIFCLKKWKSSNIYLFNLSISDLLFLCTLPILVNSYSQDHWTKDDILCHSNRFLLHANLYSSILFLTAISADRYMLIKYPFRGHVLQKRNTAVMVSVAIWIGVILELLPLVYFLEPVSPTNNYKCLDYASSGDPVRSLIYSMFLTVCGFLIPLLTMCCFYVKMARFLKTRSEQISSALTLEKPLFLVTLTVVIFSLLFTPYHVMRNVRLASRMPALNVSECTQGIISTIYIITRPFAFLNSAINPVFYFLMGDHFREMLMAKTRRLLGRLTSTRK